MNDYILSLKHALGDALSVDPQILRSYDHDLGEMPAALMMMIKHCPDMVVAAKSAEDVAKALQLAGTHNIAVTPRGQATSGYGGAIPSTGGMVLDVSNLNRVLSVDEKNATVDVEPGVIWENLSRVLAGHGLDNRISPTSAPSSSVGGWFAMGGVGIGSLRYGDIGSVVEEIDVAGLNGAITTYRGADVEHFHQTCGILGVVTRLRLNCRKKSSFIALAAWLPDADAVAEVLPLLEVESGVYSVTVQSEEYAFLRARAEGHNTPIKSGFLLSVAVLDADAERMTKRFVADHRGTMLDSEIAHEEWEGRYYPMRIKRVGPSAPVSEFFIPFEKFAAWWSDASRSLPKDKLAVEAIAAKGGRFAVLVFLLDDSRSLLYPLRMAKAMIPLRAALRNGGTIYAPGMWFAHLSRKFFGADKFRRVMFMKRLLDPKGLLNPGKIKGPGLPFIRLDLSSLIYHGSNLIAPIAAKLTYKGRSAACLPNGATR